MNPSEPPPPYEDATNRPPNSSPSTTNTTARAPPTTSTNTSHLGVPSDPSRPAKPSSSSSIPPLYRRSMEDENRPLPTGWIRQYDAESHHQFFVDTTAHPPRSIWHHPYDDETYLSTLSPAERAKVTSTHNPHVHGGEDEDDFQQQQQQHGELPPRPSGFGSGEKGSLGRKLKDKFTGTTHAEREGRRAQQDAQERAIYEQHQRFRAAMARAMETGEPQFLGKDREGREVFVEPPYGPGGGYGGGYGGGGFGGGGSGGGYGGDAYGISPYAQGVYANPNARFVRPRDPYARPGGYGYGGGLGMPLMPMMAMGGLGTGMLMGGLF